MNARQAAQVDRWAAEDQARLEVAAGERPACQLCPRPAVMLGLEPGTHGDGHTIEVWDLCEACNQGFQDVADALDPTSGVILHLIDVEAVLAAVRSGNMTGANTLDLGTLLHSGQLTATEADVIRAELGRRS